MDILFSDTSLVFSIVTINIAIALINIFVAVKIWQLRQIIARITSIVTKCEIYLQTVLVMTPPIILREKDNIHNLRDRYQLIQFKMQKLRQLLLLLTWSYRIWRRYV